MGTGRITVTGGAGFIGSNLVEGLNRRGLTDILVVDDLGRHEKWQNLAGLRFADYLQKGTFHRLLCEDRLGEAEAVFHLGAYSATTETDVGYLMENNYRFSVDLCGWCQRHRARFIYASSAATYGDGTLGYSDEDAVTPTLRPLNPYGFSKQLFDLWALRNGLLGSIVGLKFFNVYGPREDHTGEMRSVVHKAFGQIRETGEVAVFKSYLARYRDGEQIRDFVFVADAVKVALFFLDRPEACGLFNCGSGQGRTWLDLAPAVFDALDREPRIRFIEIPEDLRSRYQYYTVADTRKLRAAGYTEPFTPLEAGVREYVQSYLGAKAGLEVS